MPSDPRWFQIVFLVSFLSFGVWFRGFQIGPAQLAATYAGGLLAQAFFLKRLGLERHGYKSAVVTCTGLCLLLRVEHWWLAFLLAAAAMSSKFLLRVRGRHLYNPANFGVVVGLLSGAAWVSPGQWGHDVILAGWVALLGAAVVQRALRQDVSWAFIGCYLGLCALRVLWLGQRSAVLGHRLEDGGLLLFTFFMISDPMTIPSRRPARLLFAALTALLAFTIQFKLFRTNALFYALFLLTPASLLFDRFAGELEYRWRTPSLGGPHEKPDPAGGALGAPA
ncbi:MAG: RnfABCDGE type electron transport complex subunit D [Elusimicrobia bacterium]|nr:RnfABCDGE type electron transport complex subunit D [Elusimicrobiota bacterium]